MFLKLTKFLIVFWALFFSYSYAQFPTLSGLQPLNSSLPSLSGLTSFAPANDRPAINYSELAYLEEMRRRNLAIMAEEEKRKEERKKAKAKENKKKFFENDSTITLSKNISDVNKFLFAIARIESGGNYYARNPSGAYGKYQFIPSTWRKWANNYSTAYNIPLSQVIRQTPTNQEKVARFKAASLYRQYGNWRDVASVWFSGMSYQQVLNQKIAHQKDSPTGLTIRQYVANVLKIMNPKN